jgi:hypothetical protein
MKNSFQAVMVSITESKINNTVRLEMHDPCQAFSHQWVAFFRNIQRKVEERASAQDQGRPVSVLDALNLFFRNRLRSFFID